MDTPHTKPWLGAAIGALVALALMALSLSVDPDFRTGFAAGASMTTIALVAAFVAALGCAASVWRAAKGDIPGAVAIGWAGLPWLLSVPSSMALPAGVVPLATLAEAYAGELTLAAFGAHLAALLSLASALGLAVVAASQARGRPTRLALHAVLAIVPLWLVLLIGVNAGLFFDDVIRLALFAVVASIAGGFAVASVSVERPGSAGLALIAALGVAVSGVGVVEAIRIWPAIAVLNGAYDAFANATPAAHLGLALQLSAFAPLAVVATVLIARRRGDRVIGAGATPAVGVSTTSPSITIPGAAVATVAVALALAGPIAHRVALDGTARVVERAVQPELSTEIKAAQPPSTDAIVLPLSASVEEIERVLRAPYDAESVAIVARWPQLFDADDVRALPLLAPLVVKEPYRGVLVKTAREAAEGQAFVTSAPSVRELLRALLDARGKGREPILLRSAKPAEGSLELAQREVELLLGRSEKEIKECVRARSNGLWGIATAHFFVESGAVTRVHTDENPLQTSLSRYGRKDEAAVNEDEEDVDSKPLEACLLGVATSWRLYTPGQHDVALPIRFLTNLHTAPRPPPPKVDYDALPPLKPVDVLVVVKEHLPAIRACGAKNGESGVIKAQWEITQAGAARNVKIAGRQGGTAVGTCVEREIARWKFPASNNGVPDVRFPFRLD